MAGGEKINKKNNNSSSHVQISLPSQALFSIGVLMEDTAQGALSPLVLGFNLLMATQHFQNYEREKGTFRIKTAPAHNTAGHPHCGITD